MRIVVDTAHYSPADGHELTQPAQDTVRPPSKSRAKASLGVAALAPRVTLRGDLTQAAAEAPASKAKPSEQSALREERKKIARDLHDSFPQEFQVIIFNLRLALGSPDQSQAARYLMQALTSAEAGLRAARSYVGRLREECALEPNWGTRIAASWISAEELLREAGLGSLRTPDLDVTTTVSGSPYAFSVQIQEEVSLILREATRNVIKHARARRLVCSVIGSKDLVCVELRDDGCGFSESNRRNHGFGLKGMSERAHGLGGNLDVLSEPGRGTTVRLSIDASHPAVRRVGRGELLPATRVQDEQSDHPSSRD